MKRSAAPRRPQGCSRPPSSRGFLRCLPAGFLLLCSVASAQSARDAEAEAWLAGWLNAVRLERGLAELATDGVLSAVAAEYAADLARRGALSHVDERGGGVRQRLWSRGCTTARAGEVLGAGPDPGEIAAAWLGSPSHLRLISYGPWTHVGVGTAESGGTRVAVMVFTAVGISDLRVHHDPDLLTGRVAAPEAKTPVLLVDTRSIRPVHWDAHSREFVFPFDPEWPAGAYVRLGYYSGEGALVITDVLHPRSAVQGL